MDRTWTQLVRYKLIEDKLNDLKRLAWTSALEDEEMQESITQTERELLEIKQLIEMNGPVRKGD